MKKNRYNFEEQLYNLWSADIEGSQEVSWEYFKDAITEIALSVLPEEKFMGIAGSKRVFPTKKGFNQAIKQANDTINNGA